jgi:hypothetical protein
VKHIIPNRDIDDPAETKEIAPVDADQMDLADLGVATADEPKAPDYSEVIAQAVEAEQAKLHANKEREKRREAQALAADRFKAAAAEVQKATGLAIGYKDPWAYKPKANAAYGLWKKVVPLMVQDERTLNTGPTALARRLDDNEPNFTVTRDMLYDPLNDFAVKDLKRLLRKMGVTLKLQGPVTIRSIQKELQARRNAQQIVEAETFSGHFEIKGDTAYVNGKGYKIQLNRSGGRRIKRGVKDWLPLDTLKRFCTAE